MNRIALTLLFAAAFDASAADSIHTPQIVSSGMSLSCASWKVTGMCFWLKCNVFPPSCSVQTSIKVKHFNPDAVVSVYQTPGESPWSEMSFVSGSVSGSQSGATPANAKQQSGGAVKKQALKNSSKIINRHVDVIGSPALLTMAMLLSKTGTFCESGVTPYVPYYVSTLDYFSWKYPYADYLHLGVFVPGMNEVGERNDGENETFLFTGKFGNVYPRIGALMQNDTYKASAVFAQRAADIVTDPSAMHVYQFLGARSGRQGWWPPLKQVEEWTSKQGKWQQLYPKRDSQCHIFGEPKTRKSSSMIGVDGYSDRRSNTGDYVFQLWRPYECCEKKGQTLLYTVSF